MERRYDIDWLRVIAIGLLLLYHIAIGFQSWGFMIGFITNNEPWPASWIPMTMLNVWRIPLLFFVSGMGVYFAIQNRNWKQLFKERSLRILVPFLFGILVIVPAQVCMVQYYYHQPVSYQPGRAHLWFLGNILLYLLLLAPVFFYLQKNKEGWLARLITKCLGSPAGLLVVIAAFISEVVLIKPYLYELYAMTWHGFFLGLLAFFFGFCFMLSGAGFWNRLLQWKWVFLGAAILLYSWRLFQGAAGIAGYLLPVESNCWIFSIFAFGYLYLNRPGKALRYLSQAAYPVYILHIIFLFLASLLVFPWQVPVYIKFVLVVLFTCAGCMAFYELLVRRMNITRLLFGLKRKSR